MRHTLSVIIVSPDRREEWNSFVGQEPAFALMQSWEWGEFKTKLGWKVFRVAVQENGKIIAGAQLLIQSAPLGLGSVAYVPRGPIGNWMDCQIAPALFSELHRISQDHYAIFLKIEPPILVSSDTNPWFSQTRFFTSPQTNQPKTTMILDITQDQEVLLRDFRKKTRQYIGNSIREGVVVKQGGGKDISTLYDVMRMTGSREYFSIPVRNYFEQEWQTFAMNQQYVLLMAYYQDQLLAVRTVHRFGKHAAEFHAGSTEKSSRLHPNYLLVWEGIKWAKSQGCHTYDLWGIPDEVARCESEEGTPVPNLHDGLWGVYQFKRGFTKNIVNYVGAYDYIYNQTLYKLVKTMFLSQNIREKAVHWIDSLK